MGELIHAAGSVTGYPYVVNLFTAMAWSYYIAYHHHVDETQVALTVEALLTGFYPHSCVLWTFGRWMDPETWFNPSEYAKVHLYLTEAIAAAAGSVAVQQVVPVP